MASISLIGDSTAPYALVGSPQREIGTIIPDIVTREISSDECVITAFPVETGSPISDHAYIQPARIEMRPRFSNSTAQSEGYVQEIYQEFLALRATLTPFNVVTGKRSYQSMVFESIQVTTADETEFVLDMVVVLKEVIIVDPNGDGSSVGAMYNSDPTQQADPAQTAATSSSGFQAIGEAGGVPTFAQSSAYSFNATSPGS